MAAVACLHLLFTTQATHASCTLNDFNLYDASLRAQLDAGCGPGRDIADNGGCSFEDDPVAGTVNPLCGTETMVRDFVCLNSQLLWAPNARFCPQWQGCTWKDFDLTCDGDIVSNTVLRGVNNLDPRLRSIEIRNYYPYFLITADMLGLRLTELRSLTITNTGLTALKYGSLSSLSKLQMLNLSNNRLNYIDAIELPPFNNLVYLDLRNNSFTHPAFNALALHAAMSTCDRQSPPRLLLTDNDMCHIYTDARGCQLVNCSIAAQTPLYHSCNVHDSSAPTILAHQICDGVIDCPNGIDEVYCRAQMRLVVQQGNNLTLNQDFCNSIADQLLPDLVGTYGIGRSTIAPRSVAERIFRTSLGTVSIARIFGNKPEFTTATSILLTSAGDYLRITYNHTLGSAPATVNETCPITFTVMGLAASTTAPPALSTLPGGHNSQSASSRTTILASVFSLACVAVLFSILFVLHFRRGRRRIEHVVKLHLSVR